MTTAHCQFTFTCPVGKLPEPSLRSDVNSDDSSSEALLLLERALFESESCRKGFAALAQAQSILAPLSLWHGYGGDFCMGYCPWHIRSWFGLPWSHLCFDNLCQVFFGPRLAPL